MARNYYSELFFHFVWRTKGRLPLINQSIQTKLWAEIKNKVIEYDAIPIEVGGIEDHVHLLIEAPPTVLLSEFIGKVKGSTSHFVNHTLRAPGKFQWGEGYGVLSLAQVNVPGIREYIKGQRIHHLKGEGVREKMERCDFPDDPKVAKAFR